MSQTLSNEAWMQRDLNVLWHPCSQMKDYQKLPLIPIKKGEGVWLEDFEGNRYLDAVSSWWVNLFGHCNPRINSAIKKQLEELEHVIIAGFSHEPIITLSERLVAITPDGLNKCFYADNGSSAVEVALKMSYHYWSNCGKPEKKHFVCLSNSYHGETLGALAVSDVKLYKETYGPILMESITAPSPDCYGLNPGDEWDAHALAKLSELEALFDQRHHEISAIIVEPLVQCAGGMRMYPPIYLTQLKAICERYDIHLIADEIAVGFGRTGTLFACEQANITPDFLCLSKGLTGGYLPLSTVLTTNKVYDAFYDDYEKLTAFLHSHSYTGNPLGCAAALATLDIFETENVIENNQLLSKEMAAAAAPLIDHPQVGNVRQTGMIMAIEMVKDKSSQTPYPWQERRGLKVFQHAISKGVLVRPLGNVVYFMPPYVITQEQVRWVCDVAAEAIDAATSTK